MTGTVLELEELAEAQVTLINEVADQLRSLRKLVGFTQEELAQRLGLSQPRIAQIESGKPGNPASLEQIAAYAHHCGAVIEIKMHESATLHIQIRKQVKAELQNAYASTS